MINLLIIISLLLGMVVHMMSPAISGALSSSADAIVCLLLIFIGIGIGTQTQWTSHFKNHAMNTLIICCGVIAGSMLAGTLIGMLHPQYEIGEALLITSGMGFYSLASIMIRDAGLHHIAVVALFANLLRETLSLTFTPIIRRMFGELAPIAATASASDSGAPVITANGREGLLIPCIASAFILSLCVPLLIRFILSAFGL